MNLTLSQQMVCGMHELPAHIRTACERDRALLESGHSIAHIRTLNTKAASKKMRGWLEKRGISSKTGARMSKKTGED